MSTNGTTFAAAWMDKRRGEGDRDVYWSLSNTPHFNNDSLVHADAGGDQDHPSIAIDSAGKAWMVWENHSGQRPQVWLRTSDQNDDSRCLSSESDEAFSPSIACGGGIVAIAYQVGRGRNSKVVVHAMKDDQ